MMNRTNYTTSICCFALLLLCTNCAKVDTCDDQAHLHRVTGKTTVTVDWSQTVGDDAEKECMKFAFYPEKGGEPILIDTDHGFVQTCLEPGSYRVIAFNRNVENIEFSLPADYREAKASVSAAAASRNGETSLNIPGWLASGVDNVEVDETRTGELVLSMRSLIHPINVHFNIEGDTKLLKQVTGEIKGVIRSANLNTQELQEESGKTHFNATIEDEQTVIHISAFGIINDEGDLSMTLQLADQSTVTFQQDISQLLPQTDGSDKDMELDILATILVEKSEEDGKVEATLEEVTATYATTLDLKWDETSTGMPIPDTVEYALYPADGGAPTFVSGNNKSKSLQLTPGKYRILAYGKDAENITVTCPADIAQATALLEANKGIIPEPGYFFLASTDFTVETNKMQTCTLPMKNQTKEFLLSMDIEGNGQLVKEIEASLTGLSRGIYLNTGEVMKNGASFVLHTAQDATSIKVNGHILGIDPDLQQVLTLKLIYNTGEEQVTENDISELLKDFNDIAPGEIPEIKADVIVTVSTEAGVSATISNWKVVERKIEIEP